MVQNKKIENKEKDKEGEIEIKSIKLKKKKYVGLSYFSCVLKRKNSDTSNWVIKMKRVS